MERYQRVEKPRPESAIQENEIRITTQGMIRNYISYATSLLQEKRMNEIVLKAMGQATSKAVAIVEVLKKRNPGLHQHTEISSTSIVDVWEPTEEGLVPLEMTRHVSLISITLSLKELNKNSPGYQAPGHVAHTRPHYPYYQKQQWRETNAPVADGADVAVGFSQSAAESNGQRYFRGRGRGRYIGRYGGGYDEGYDRGYHGNRENGGWNHGWSQGGGRGRVWGDHGGAEYERERGSGGVRGGFGRGRGRRAGQP